MLLRIEPKGENNMDTNVLLWRISQAETENRRLMNCQGQIVQDANRKLQKYQSEIQMMKDQNLELRELCCYLDEQRQRAKKLSAEWQHFGRQTAQVMKQVYPWLKYYMDEIAVYQERVRELQTCVATLAAEKEKLRQESISNQKQFVAETDADCSSSSVSSESLPDSEAITAEAPVSEVNANDKDSPGSDNTGSFCSKSYSLLATKATELIDASPPPVITSGLATQDRRCPALSQAASSSRCSTSSSSGTASDSDADRILSRDTAGFDRIMEYITVLESRITKLESKDSSATEAVSIPREAAADGSDINKKGVEKLENVLDNSINIDEIWWSLSATTLPTISEADEEESAFLKIHQTRPFFQESISEPCLLSSLQNELKQFQSQPLLPVKYNRSCCTVEGQALHQRTSQLMSEKGKRILLPMDKELPDRTLAVLEVLKCARTEDLTDKERTILEEMCKMVLKSLEAKESSILNMI